MIELNDLLGKLKAYCVRQNLKFPDVVDPCMECKYTDFCSKYISGDSSVIPLSEEELKIAVMVGAEYLSRDHSIDSDIDLWTDEPDFPGQVEEDLKSLFYSDNGKKYIGTLSQELFPSMQPGDLVRTYGNFNN